MSEWNGCENRVSSKVAQSQLPLDFLTLDWAMSQGVSWNMPSIVAILMSQKHHLQYEGSEVINK